MPIESVPFLLAGARPASFEAAAPIPAIALVR
jgi:hypothetical protein